MFGFNKLFGNKDDQHAQEKPAGPDPERIRDLLETHPAFQILSVDGLKWIDPHSLTCVDCPFGYVETALDWLLEHKPWHLHPCRHLKEVRMKRWWLHIKENIDLDSRWKIFNQQGVWLNPFIGCLEPRAQLADNMVSRETITQMARSLVEYEEAQLKDLLSSDKLRQALESNPNAKPETHRVIKSTDRFVVGEQQTPSALPDVHSEAQLQLAQDPDATIATDFNMQFDADPDATIATDFNQQPIMDESQATIEVGDFTPVTNTDQTINVDFSQGSLLEPPSHSKPIKNKKTESIRRAAHDPEIGDRIAGYQIVSFLGKGGMGNVHKAIQMSMQREVALKILPPELCRDETFSARFIREARAAGKVNHPNVITCFDVGNDKGVLYMALELVTGGDVSQKLKENKGPLSVKQALRIFQDCTRGLGAIHKAGLIHRDIKPANIFLSEDGIAKLADLGLARSASTNTQMTQAGSCVGTPAYMSPEQVKGAEDIDIRTDIYALGITLFTLLAAKNPFQANDVWALFRIIIEEQPPNICELNKDVDEGINTLIQKCLAKDRNDRFQTPKELLEALDELI